jgi:hypothetical protein
MEKDGRRETERARNKEEKQREREKESERKRVRERKRERENSVLCSRVTLLSYEGHVMTSFYP